MISPRVSAALQMIFVFCVTLAVTAVFAVRGVDPHHDGIVLRPALDVAAGDTLYRDSFAQYGTLTTYIQVAAIELLGPYMLSVRLVTALCYALTSVLLWLCWRKLIPDMLAAAAVMVWLMLGGFWILTFMAWSSVYSLLFQTTACYLLLSYLESRKSALLYAAGGASALAFWARQPVGILLAAAVLVFFLLAGRERGGIRAAGRYVLGLMAVNAIFVLHLISTESLQDWWLQAFVLPYEFGKLAGNGFSFGFLLTTLFPQPFSGGYYTLTFSGSLIWSMFPVLCVLSMLDEVLLPRDRPAQSDVPRHRRRAVMPIRLSDRGAKLLLMTGICMASWAQYYPVPCVRHVFWGATPMIGMFFYFFWEVVPSYLNPLPDEHAAAAD